MWWASNTRSDQPVSRENNQSKQDLFVISAQMATFLPAFLAVSIPMVSLGNAAQTAPPFQSLCLIAI